MEDYDAFCLPDDVLAAIVELETTSPAPSAITRPAAALSSTSFEAAQGVSMFDAFLPPGPLRQGIVGSSGAPVQAAVPSTVTAHTGVGVIASPASGLLPVSPQQGDGVGLGGHCAALGEAQLLRAKLEQVEQQAQQARAPHPRQLYSSRLHPRHLMPCSLGCAGPTASSTAAG
jgi:hypothetical protein